MKIKLIITLLIIFYATSIYAGVENNSACLANPDGEPSVNACNSINSACQASIEQGILAMNLQTSQLIQNASTTIANYNSTISNCFANLASTDAATRTAIGNFGTGSDTAYNQPNMVNAKMAELTSYTTELTAKSDRLGEVNHLRYCCDASGSDCSGTIDSPPFCASCGCNATVKDNLDRERTNLSDRIAELSNTLIPRVNAELEELRTNAGSAATTASDALIGQLRTSDVQTQECLNRAANPPTSVTNALSDLQAYSSDLVAQSSALAISSSKYYDEFKQLLIFDGLAQADPRSQAAFDRDMRLLAVSIAATRLMSCSQHPYSSSQAKSHEALKLAAAAHLVSEYEQRNTYQNHLQCVVNSDATVDPQLRYLEQMQAVYEGLQNSLISKDEFGQRSRDLFIEAYKVAKDETARRVRLLEDQEDRIETSLKHIEPIFVTFAVFWGRARHFDDAEHTDCCDDGRCDYSCEFLNNVESMLANVFYNLAYIWYNMLIPIFSTLEQQIAEVMRLRYDGYLQCIRSPEIAYNQALLQLHYVVKQGRSERERVEIFKKWFHDFSGKDILVKADHGLVKKMMNYFLSEAVAIEANPLLNDILTVGINRFMGEQQALYPVYQQFENEIIKQARIQNNTLHLAGALPVRTSPTSPASYRGDNDVLTQWQAGVPIDLMPDTSDFDRWHKICYKEPWDSELARDNDIRDALSFLGHCPDEQGQNIYPGQSIQFTSEAFIESHVPNPDHGNVIPPLRYDRDMNASERGLATPRWVYLSTSKEIGLATPYQRARYLQTIIEDYNLLFQDNLAGLSTMGPRLDQIRQMITQFKMTTNHGQSITGVALPPPPIVSSYLGVCTEGPDFKIDEDCSCRTTNTCSKIGLNLTGGTTTWNGSGNNRWGGGSSGASMGGSGGTGRVDLNARANKRLDEMKKSDSTRKKKKISPMYDEKMYELVASMASGKTDQALLASLYPPMQFESAKTTSRSSKKRSESKEVIASEQKSNVKKIVEVDKKAKTAIVIDKDGNKKKVSLEDLIGDVDDLEAGSLEGLDINIARGSLVAKTTSRSQENIDDSVGSEEAPILADDGRTLFTVISDRYKKVAPKKLYELK